MAKSLDEALSALAGSRVSISSGNAYPEPEQVSIALRFSTGVVLTAAYWRIIENGRAGISTFDHRQQYGWPAPIDAFAVLQKMMTDREVVGASLEHTTGDLHFTFAGDISLQVFNFTGYEIWDIKFPDGSIEYSNYNK
jgi:hypothetical protein